MRILHLIKTSEGAAWALTLIKSLKAAHPELEFSVVLPAGGKNFEAYREVCSAVYAFDFKIGPSMLTEGLKLRQIVKKDRPDIIHGWFVQTTLYARMFLRGIKVPKIFQVVGPLHLESKLLQKMDVRSAGKQDYWIATSQYIYDKYRNAGIPDNKLLLNYALVDLEKLEQDTHKPTEDIRGKYGIPEHAQIIGTASYIYPPKPGQKTGLKGHEILLDVFAMLLQDKPDLYLVIGGTTFNAPPDYEETLKAKAKAISPDRIIFTGRYSNVYALISNFDVFVYLSQSENLGGVYESLYYGIPTVSSDRGALPELVENGITGFNCPLDNVAGIAGKIKLLLEDKQYKPLFYKNGKDRVLNFFDKETIVAKTAAFYAELDK